MELKLVAIEKPDPINFVLGQSHFIKTVEDMYEALVTSVSARIPMRMVVMERRAADMLRTSGCTELAWHH